MDLLKTWIANISVTIVFITAIKLILPENGTKKYVNFVMGIILIAVIIQPILTFFNSSEKISQEITNNLNINNINNKESNINISESKKKVFIDNLEKSCVTVLKSEFEGKDFKVQIEGDIDLDKVNVSINEVQVGVDDSTTIKKIEKVKIGTSKNQGTTESALTNSIKDKLSKELGISKDKIIVYMI